MNIVFINRFPFHPKRGGVERVTDSLCKELQLRGYDIYYVVETFPNNYNDYNYPAEIFILNDLQKNKFKEFVNNKSIDVIVNQSSMSQTYSDYLDGLNVKIISVFHNDPALGSDNLLQSYISFVGLSLKSKIKNVFSLILYPIIKRRKINQYKKKYRKIISQGSHIVLLSSRFKSVLNRIVDSEVSKVSAIPNPNTYNKIDKIPAKEKIILFVGRLDNYQKRVIYVLEIWRSLYQKHLDWKLQIIGDGPDRKELEKYASKYNIERIEFCGNQDPRKYYERASILCLTSFYEGWGMVLTEAMQFGCIPMAFDSYASVRDIIKPEENGELIKPFDINDYLHKLSALIDNDDYRCLLSQNAFASVDHFNLRNITNKWVDLFKEL